MLRLLYRFHRGALVSTALLAAVAAAVLGYALYLGAFGIGTARAHANAAVAALDKMHAEMRQQPFDGEDPAKVWAHYVAFNEQTRGAAEDSLTAARLFEGLAERHRMFGLTYDFGDVQRGDVGQVGVFGYSSAGRNVVIDVGAILDSDALAFVRDAVHALSGGVAIREVTLEREVPVTPDLLETISTGERPEVVHLHMRLDWQAPAKRG